jgi:SAM-dependent methyltransferase
LFARLYARMFGYRIVGRHERCDLCGHGESLVVGRYDRRLRPLTNVMCLRCGLVRQDPMPTEQELSKFYEREYRLQQKGVAEPRRRHLQRDLAHSADRLNKLKPLLRPGARILDVGSGGGGFVHIAAEAGFEASGIEPNVGYAEWSKRQFGISVYIGTWETADIAPGSRDLIVAHHVMEHLRAPSAALARFHEWLAPDGLLWLEVPNLKSADRSPLSQFQFWHVHGFTPETLAMIALKAGFVRVSGRPDRTVGVFRRLPAPPRDWFLFPDHAREMQRFFGEQTFLRYLLQPKAFRRAVRHVADAIRER